MTEQQVLLKKEKCLEKGRKYYEENKERLQKRTPDQYRRLSEEEKK